MIASKRGVLHGLRRNPAGQSRYDSHLERNYMRELEAEGGIISWTKEHGIRIPYKTLGIIPRTYLPDFLVTYANGTQELHETKGAGFLFWLETHAKRAAADQWCRAKNMRYKFIENSKGALFAVNQGLAQTHSDAGKFTKHKSLDDLLK